MAPTESSRPAAGRSGQGALARGLALLAAAAVLGAVVTLAPEPLAERLIEADIRDSAGIHEARILGQLDAGAITFTTGALSEADQRFLAAVTQSSDIRRIDLLDRGGRVFWSSRPELVGTLDEGAQFARTASQEEVSFEIDHVPAGAVDDFRFHAAIADPGQDLRAVAEIDLPVLLDGEFVGGIELRRDINQLSDVFIRRIRLILGILSAGTALSLLMVVALLDRASRAEMRVAEARAEEQRAALAEQARLAREVRLLGELNAWLQSSRSLPELFSMVARFMSHILPGCSGSLYVYSNSRDVLEGSVSWNGASHDDQIRPEDCWGLRRGRAYAFGESEVDFACGHMHYEHPRRYICIPILAHGEAVGLMTLTAKSATGPEAFEASRRIARTSAEQISLAVANVRMRDALHHQAIRDPLTGLFNRRHLLDTLRRQIEGRFPGGVALLSIDVDHFKRFNDNHGHDAGDMVLRAVGEVLNHHADGDRLACRIGGEEFMLLLPGASEEEALEEAERLRGEVAALSVRYGDRTLPHVTVSMGVALHPRHGTLPQELIRSADDALYLAKARGRNQAVLAGTRRAVPQDEAAAWTLDRHEEERAQPGPLAQDMRG